MTYQQYPVHPALRNWIRYFWSYDVYTTDVQALHIRSFADRYPRLIFQDMNTSSPIREATGSAKPICYLSGIDTLPTEAFWESRFSHFGVSFQPHALQAIFGIRADELTNQTPDLQLLEKKELTDWLLGAKDHTERTTILSHYFYGKLAQNRPDAIINDLFCGHWADELDDGLRLGALANHYHLSERQFQRRFKQSVGVSARKFARLAKFEKSLGALANARYGSLTQLAYSLGYTDQSHFIKDFQLFSGLSPYAFAKDTILGSESSSFIYLE